MGADFSQTAGQIFGSFELGVETRQLQFVGRIDGRQFVVGRREPLNILLSVGSNLLDLLPHRGTQVLVRLYQLLTGSFNTLYETGTGLRQVLREFLSTVGNHLGGTYITAGQGLRSEERRVGKECRARWGGGVCERS